jgi:hypothetical protein
LAKHRVEERGQPIAAWLRQPANRVHCRSAKPDHEIASSDQREGFLLFDCAVRDGAQNLRIKPCEAGKLLSIGVIALTITMRDRP